MTPEGDQAWDVEIGRRCLDALTPAEIQALLALPSTAVQTWLDAHLPDHRAIVRASRPPVTGR